MAENNVIGVIPNVHSGMFGQKAYNLIVTGQGLIIAQLTNEMIKSEVNKASKESKEKGDGILKRMANTMMAGNAIYQRYFSMTVDQIVQETPGNVFIAEADMKKIRIKTSPIYDDGKKIPNELKLVWNGGKKKFSFDQITPKEAKNLLKQTFGRKIK